MLNKSYGSLRDGNDSLNILELSRNKDVVKVEAKEDPDATENSSSFVDTASENENTFGLSDAEVESQFFGDSDLAPAFNEFGSTFPIRKKKLTAHWRNFIHPLMWRCKWTELRIKELESMASKYRREISSNDHGKQMALDQTGSKSVPFMHQSRRKKLMKRRKRKRLEDTTDIASFFSNHILFSERENKRSDLGGVPTGENIGTSDQHASGYDEFGIHDETAFPEENDNCIEHMFHKIELINGRVKKLKVQLDSVITRNGVTMFSSSENLSQLMAGDVQQTSSVHSQTLSPCNGDTVSVGGLYTSSPHMSDCDLGDFIIPDSTISSFGEAIPIPDIIESTVGLLTSIDVTEHHPQVGDSSEKIVDNILIHNEAAEVEAASPFKYSRAVEDENSGEGESDNAGVVSEVDTSPTAFATPEQSSLKSCLVSEFNFPKNKKKRGERKAGCGNWSRKRPGEANS